VAKDAVAKAIDGAFGQINRRRCSRTNSHRRQAKVVSVFLPLMTI
jgi:hypothetical protein